MSESEVPKSVAEFRRDLKSHLEGKPYQIEVSNGDDKVRKRIATKVRVTLWDWPAKSLLFLTCYGFRQWIRDGASGIHEKKAPGTERVLNDAERGKALKDLVERKLDAGRRGVLEDGQRGVRVPPLVATTLAVLNEIGVKLDKRKYNTLEAIEKWHEGVYVEGNLTFEALVGEAQARVDEAEKAAERAAIRAAKLAAAGLGKS